MPCNCDHMEPTQKETLLRAAANNQVYVRTKLKMTVPAWLKRDAKDIYAKDERSETELCKILTDLGKAKRDELLYADAKDAKMRDVATWWEKHEKADKARKLTEKKLRTQKAQKAEALAKLSPADKKALGLK